MSKTKRYLKLLRSDMTGGWSTTPWPESGEFKRKTDRDPVCGASGIWLLDSAEAAVDWMKLYAKGYCNVALVESDDPHPVVLTNGGRKVGVRSALVVTAVSFKPLADAYDAQRKPLDDAYDAQRKPLDDAYYAQRKPLDDAYDAQCKPLDDAYDAQRKPLDDAYDAQRKTLDDAYYAQRKTLADAYYAQCKPLDDAYYTQLYLLFDNLLCAGGANE